MEEHQFKTRLIGNSKLTGISKINLPLIYLVISIFVINCNYFNNVSYNYQVPGELKDGIKVGGLPAVKLDSNLIYRTVKRIKGGAYGQIHSFLIFKNNLLVLEEYFPGNRYLWEAEDYIGERVTWTHDDLHNIMSVTKSITSICIGIAIDKGFIKSVHQSIFDYLPDHRHLKTNEKNRITIEHLLTMTSGLEWTEWGESYHDFDNPIIGIWFSEKDPVSFILEGSLVYKPGAHFSYYGGNHILLGEILKNATGLYIDEFADEFLFKKMGIDSVQWTKKFSNGVIESAGCLKITPRDMIKIGALMLNNGNWNDKQILSDDWIKNCNTPYSGNTGIIIPGEDWGNVCYSYSWWIKSVSYKGNKLNAVFSLGWGGQKIIVIPKLEMVLVFTGANYKREVHEFEILEQFILQALQ